MQMVAHHGVGVDGDRETFGDQTNPRLDPRLAVFEGTTGVVVGPAQEGATHASLNAMVSAGGIWRGDVAAGAGHAAAMIGLLSAIGCRDMPHFAVRKFRIVGVPFIPWWWCPLVVVVVVVVVLGGGGVGGVLGVSLSSMGVPFGLFGLLGGHDARARTCSGSSPQLGPQVSDLQKLH
jgi:hypothetical protein